MGCFLVNAHFDADESHIVCDGRGSPAKIRPNIAFRERGRGWISDNSGVDTEHDQKVQDSASQAALRRRTARPNFSALICLTHDGERRDIGGKK